MKQVEQQSLYYYIYRRRQTSATNVAPSKYFLNQAEPMKKQMFDEMFMVRRNPLVPLQPALPKNYLKPNVKLKNRNIYSVFKADDLYRPYLFTRFLPSS